MCRQPSQSETTNHQISMLCSKMTALERVFLLPELVDSILYHLPPETLLLVVRLVCKQWRLASTQSPATASRLFLEAASPGSNLFAQPTFNPIISKTYWNWLKPRSQLPDKLFEVVTSSWPGGCRCGYVHEVRRPVQSFCLPWYRLSFIWNVKNASWKDMLVVQPPCMNLAFKCKVSGWKQDGRGYFQDSLSGVLGHEDGLPVQGLTMGFLHDIIEGWRNSQADYILRLYKKPGVVSSKIHAGEIRRVSGRTGVMSFSAECEIELWDADNYESLFLHLKKCC
jgi:hypothetical protein